MVEENKIEKLVITLTEKKYADELKADLAEAGVLKTDMRIRNNKKTRQCDLHILNAQSHMSDIIDMFRSHKFGLTIPEIEKLLNIQITAGF